MTFATELRLPSLGPDMESGKLLEWRIKPGQKIKKGDVIAVVDTEKTAIDVESWQEGTVADLVAAPGDVLAVGAVMARLTDGGAAAAPPQPPTLVRASPAARARAHALGIDIDKIPTRTGAAAVTVSDVEAFAAPSPATDRPSSLRHAIAAAMTRSKRDIPHYYLWDDVDVSAMTRWLSAANATRPVTDRLLPAAVLLCAIARAASEFNDMNGTYDGTRYLPAEHVNLGVAIALRGGGLIAPAIAAAQAHRVTTLMPLLNDLVRRARSGGLRSSEVSGQTLTVTQLGEGSSRGLLGAIYPPQVALIGVGRIEPRARVVDGMVVARDCVTISLAADHRVSDGRRGALFLGRISQLLQDPETL